MRTNEHYQKDKMCKGQSSDEYNFALVRSIQREKLSSQCTLKNYEKCSKLLDESHDRDVLHMLRAQNRVHMHSGLRIMQRSMESTTLRTSTSEESFGAVCVPCANK